MPFYMQQIAEKLGDREFEFMDQTGHVTFRWAKVTREFRMEYLRLNRELLKTERRLKALMGRIVLVQAADGSVEATAEDEDAELALREIRVTDERIKREVDRAIACIVHTWDLLAGDGTPVPVFKRNDDKTIPLDEWGNPFPSEELFTVPAEFEIKVLDVILNGGDVVGEASNGKTKSNVLPLHSKRRAKPVISHRYQGGTRSSKQVSIVPQSSRGNG
jgi:hypothetical protein